MKIEEKDGLKLTVENKEDVEILNALSRNKLKHAEASIDFITEEIRWIKYKK